MQITPSVPFLLALRVNISDTRGKMHASQKNLSKNPSDNESTGILQEAFSDSRLISSPAAFITGKDEVKLPLREAQEAPCLDFFFQSAILPLASPSHPPFVGRTVEEEESNLSV